VNVIVARNTAAEQAQISKNAGAKNSSTESGTLFRKWFATNSISASNL